MHDVPRRTHTLHVRTRRGTFRCTVYSPPEAVAGPPPVYVNLHGGGFVIRHPEADDHICRYLAAAVGCVVVNVDYDVAPQRPFPAASIQAYDVVQWVADHAAEQGWDGSRLAVGGQSAGGNLAPEWPSLPVTPGHLLLPSRSCSTRPSTSPSIRAEARPHRQAAAHSRAAPALRRRLRPRPSQRADPLLSPLLAADLAGVAPAVVVTAELDLLRDEADAYAAALADAGVPVSHHVSRASTTRSRTVTGPGRQRHLRRGLDALRAAFAETAPTTPSPGASR